MHRLNKVDVFYHDRQVGTMVLYENRFAAFDKEQDVTELVKYIWS